MVLLSLGIGLALGACGTYPTLAQAIKCDQFKRSADGSWITRHSLSVEFRQARNHHGKQRSPECRDRRSTGEEM
jgi:hypothetical protein